MNYTPIPRYLMHSNKNRAIIIISCIILIASLSAFILYSQSQKKSLKIKAADSTISDPLCVGRSRGYPCAMKDGVVWGECEGGGVSDTCIITPSCKRGDEFMCSDQDIYAYECRDHPSHADKNCLKYCIKEIPNPYLQNPSCNTQEIGVRCGCHPKPKELPTIIKLSPTTIPTQIVYPSPTKPIPATPTPNPTPYIPTFIPTKIITSIPTIPPSSCPPPQQIENVKIACPFCE